MINKIQCIANRQLFGHLRWFYKKKAEFCFNCNLFRFTVVTKINNRPTQSNILTLTILCYLLICQKPCRVNSSDPPVCEKRMSSSGSGSRETETEVVCRCPDGFICSGVEARTLDRKTLAQSSVTCQPYLTDW